MKVPAGDVDVKQRSALEECYFGGSEHSESCTWDGLNIDPGAVQMYLKSTLLAGLQDGQHSVICDSQLTDC